MRLSVRTPATILSVWSKRQLRRTILNLKVKNHGKLLTKSQTPAQLADHLQLLTSLRGRLAKLIRTVLKTSSWKWPTLLTVTPVHLTARWTPRKTSLRYSRTLWVVSPSFSKLSRRRPNLDSGSSTRTRSCRSTELWKRPKAVKTRLPEKRPKSSPTLFSRHCRRPTCRTSSLPWCTDCLVYQTAYWGWMVHKPYRVLSPTLKTSH